MIDPADPDQLERLLRRHRVGLRHSLGQNFLVDPGIRDAVAHASGASSADEVLEVGAGVGTLTIALAGLCRRVVAIEIDPRLEAALREVTSDAGNVEIVRADILRFDPAAAFPDGGELVAGNIPYNLTGALIRKLLDRPPRPRRLALVVQKEVAQRWAATSGAGLSTVAVQVYAEARVVLTIPAAAFTPVPRVDSALVILDVRDRPAVEVDDMDRFFRLVESVFQHRRKQLGGALGRVAGITSTESGGRVRGLGIDPTRRAQTLSLAEWEAVYRAFNPGLDR
ncbi:MAG TPA: 16S rRNA (adenine(1518)-N(6)/adenine(1519)-N(6))-dimethyltransferase RsmA [Candidatus Dormibacteraeota bacterium]